MCVLAWCRFSTIPFMFIHLFKIFQTHTHKLRHLPRKSKLHAIELGFSSTIFAKRWGFDLDTWGITKLATVWEFMALSRTSKVSRSLDRQRRIPKNSLYRWNNWCTCPRGGSDFNFCPRRSEIRDEVRASGKICTPQKVAVWPLRARRRRRLRRPDR